MKHSKTSKILVLSLGIAAFASALLSDKVIAASSTSYNRSVRDMMARRHNASVLKKESERQQPVFFKQNSAPQVRTETPTVNYKQTPQQLSVATVQNATAPISFSLASLFDAADKDGSIFPGGPCKNCHNTGPLIDTGPCERCYNGGALFDTGSCERCYNKGAIFDTGSCERCYKTGGLIDTGPCKKCKEASLPECPSCLPPKLVNYTLSYETFVPRPEPRDCCAFAPLYLDHVDFNLIGDENAIQNKMGNYRFRIFGCRRFDREAILNHGRVMEKNMHLIDIFNEITGDCYKIIQKPDDLCLQTTYSMLPEYVLTAEITDFFMNICDGYDWEGNKTDNTRSGRSEIKVVWKLSNLTKTKVVWQGETTGYGDLSLSEEQGEIALVEAAFADAVKNLQEMPGFENQLMVRLTPEELTAERNALIEEEIALDPAKCRFAEPLRLQMQCELTRPDVDIMECPAVIEQLEPEPCVEPCPVIEEDAGVEAQHQVLDNCIDENGGVIEGGDCAVVDDTWVDTKVKAFDSLCITARAPYDVLSPENLYKVRASVVEISSANGKKGAGLIVSDSFVLTSADLADTNNSACKIRTINGKELSGRTVRVNPGKNTALIMLSEKTQYLPLSLSLDLPKVGQTGFMTLGLLDVEDFDNGSENYIENNGKVLGYRYSQDKGSEIIVDTDIQNITIGSVLIDAHGSVHGVAHTGQKTDDGKDLFLPTETTLRSLGLTICGYVYEEPSPWQQTVYHPVTELIKVTPVDPGEMKVEERK